MRNAIMVINCLLPYLLRFRRNVHFREFSGQIVAIDASCWIHKALSVSHRVEIEKGEIIC